MVTVYGIPTCSTVGKARAWLAEQGVEHSFVDFRQTPVEADRIRGWVASLGAKPLKNTSGKAYRALPAERNEWDDPTWAEQFVADPMLLKRPVIEVDGQVVMAGFRKPSVLEEALAGR